MSHHPICATLDEALDLCCSASEPIATFHNLFDSYPNEPQLHATLMITLDQRTSVYDPTVGADPLLSSLLEKLSHSTDMSVRWGVAKNSHTPVATLERLASDPVNLVRALVATNPHTPQPFLVKLFSDEKIVRDGLSGNPSTPEKYLTLLSGDTDRMVRIRIADNPATPLSLLEKLRQDSDPDVAKAAEKNSEGRI
jgi:hypothetical protein